MLHAKFGPDQLKTVASFGEQRTDRLLHCVSKKTTL